MSTVAQASCCTHNPRTRSTELLLKRKYEYFLSSQHVLSVSSPMQNVHEIKRPTFHDLNRVAAHALASLLCPARHRPIRPTADGPGNQTPGRQPPGLSDMRTPPSSRASGFPQSTRSSTYRVSPQSDGQHNSPAVLSHIPTQLGRQVMIADIVRQV